MINENQAIEQHIELWLQKFIIGHDICPFAKIPYQKGLIRLAVAPQNQLGLEEQLYFFHEEAHLLATSAPEKLATTLIVFPDGASDFIDFLDFAAAAEAVLADMNLAHVFQVVVFHPQFRFEGNAPQERGNWVNRSPYPLLHLLRQRDLDQITSRGVDGAEIAHSNHRKLTQMKSEQWKEILALSCPLPNSSS